jgi:hypothetical protein
MPSFSERYGYKPVREALQIQSIDIPLKNSLWNVIYANALEAGEGPSDYLEARPIFYRVFLRLWLTYFKLPLDEMPSRWSHGIDFLKNYFFKAAWYDIYDFVEHVVKGIEEGRLKTRLNDTINSVLEAEMAGYRLVADEMIPVTSEIELSEIEAALESSTRPVERHLTRALELLSDRKDPDYRNSVKESISAVEAAASTVAGDPKATLGQALGRLEKAGGANLHPALNAAFKKLYGYTSDSDGIRHALLDEDVLQMEDARFMLVACSAFVNYLTEKGAKAGLLGVEKS